MRLRFAKDHEHWTVDKWRKVVFVDECYFQDNLKHQNLKVKCPIGSVNKPRNQNTYLHQRKFKVNVFGFISAGNKHLFKFEGRMNQNQYENILGGRGGLSLMNLNLASGPECKLIFLQDNAKYHLTEPIIRAISAVFDILPIPPYSPDINCIENIWAIVKYRLRQSLKNVTIESNDHLLEIINSHFADLDPQIQSLINSMPKRMKKIIENEGAMTKY